VRITVGFVYATVIVVDLDYYGRRESIVSMASCFAPASSGDASLRGRTPGAIDA
jgi:hypothetical protein